MLEREVERIFHRRIRALGGLTFKLAPTHVGLPDRIVVLPDIPPLLVELKSDTGSLEPSQRVLFARLAALGTHVIVVRGPTEAREFTPPLGPPHLPFNPSPLPTR